jgi:hypothetical protein
MQNVSTFCSFYFLMLSVMMETECAKRWQHSLDPNVDHSKWEQGDDELLLQSFNKNGRNWKAIREESFKNRSTTDIKNR